MRHRRAYSWADYETSTHTLPTTETHIKSLSNSALKGKQNVFIYLFEFTYTKRYAYAKFMCCVPFERKTKNVLFIPKEEKFRYQIKSYRITISYILLYATHFHHWRPLNEFIIKLSHQI